MISNTFVRGSYFDRKNDEIQSIYNAISYKAEHALTTYDNALSMKFEDFTYDGKYYSENVIGDALKSIGDGIIDMVNRVVKFIDDLIVRVKEAFWNKKSDAQKLEAIVKAHPELSKEIKYAFMNGELNIRDVKSLSDVLDGTYDILGKLNSGKLDEVGAKSKFDKIVDAYNSKTKGIFEAIITTGKVALGIGSIVGIGNVLRKNYIETQQLRQKVENMKNMTALQANITKTDSNGNKQLLVSKGIISKLLSLVTSQLSALGKSQTRFGQFVTNLTTRFGKYEDLEKVRDKVNVGQIQARDRENIDKATGNVLGGASGNVSNATKNAQRRSLNTNIRDVSI